MRIQPPENWPDEYIDRDRFDEYIKNHIVIIESGDKTIKKIKLFDFFDYMSQHGEDRFETAMKMSVLFPYSRQMAFLGSVLRITSRKNENTD